MMKTKKKVFIGADHGGFDLKESLRDFLKDKEFEVVDKGTLSNERCDYPDFAFDVAESVAQHSGSVGIVICTTGIGAS
ncbi:RpiB/LacA/LacB family sugar-phosphate isomerase, partial [Candidatus Omnitrophota bacterium]